MNRLLPLSLLFFTSVQGGSIRLTDPLDTKTYLRLQNNSVCLGQVCAVTIDYVSAAAASGQLRCKYRLNDVPVEVAISEPPKTRVDKALYVAQCESLLSISPEGTKAFMTSSDTAKNYVYFSGYLADEYRNLSDDQGWHQTKRYYPLSRPLLNTWYEYLTLFHTGRWKFLGLEDGPCRDHVNARGCLRFEHLTSENPSVTTLVEFETEKTPQIEENVVITSSQAASGLLGFTLDELVLETLTASGKNPASIILSYAQDAELFFAYR